MKNNKKYTVVILIFFFFAALGSGFSAGDKNAEKKIKPDIKKTQKEVKKPEAGKDVADSPIGKDYTEEDFKPKVQEESTGWMLFKTLIILGLMVGGFYYFFRFVTKKAGIQLVGENVIQVLSIVPVGQNRYLQVVDVAGKMFVLGITENNINMITEITDREEKDRIRLMSSRSRPVKEEGGFQDYFFRQIGRVSEIIKDKG